MSIPSSMLPKIVEISNLDHYIDGHHYILKNVKIELYLEPDSASGYFRVISHQGKELCDT